MSNRLRMGREAAGLAAVLLLASAVGCSSPGGKACATSADCQDGYECVSSGGVLFGSRICLLSARGGADVSMDAGVDADAATAVDASTDAGDASTTTDADAGLADAPASDAGDVCSQQGCPDFDNDGIPDDVDNCPTVANPDQSNQDGDATGDVCDSDLDGDGVDNTDDNCPRTDNPGQEDANGDGVGDACSDDADGDGVLDGNDNCPATANADQSDIDSDGQGDVCDDDMDGDGVDNVDDNCPDAANPLQQDQDADGTGDACDDDRDGDGVDNASDNCPERANPQQADRDGDHIGDACDPELHARNADVSFGEPFIFSTTNVLWWVASGDVTGDGTADLIISGPRSRWSSGSVAVYVFDGRNLGSGQMTFNDAITTIETTDFDPYLGLKVAVVGDVNDDGIDDLLVGNPGGHNGSGDAYLFYGGRDVIRAKTMSDASVSIKGSSSRAGTAVAGIGDINGDGIDDFAVGEPQASGGDGNVAVFLGSPSLPSDLRTLDAAMHLAGQHLAKAGSALAGVGDVNGDGVDDFVAGSPGKYGGIGAAELVYGYPPGQPLPAAQVLDNIGVELKVTSNGSNNNALIGTSVAGAGDLDGDGHNDVAIGAPKMSTLSVSDGGAVYVVFGQGASMPARGSSMDLDATALQLVGPQGSSAGAALAAGGDIDGDGALDLLVGAPTTSGSGPARAGAVFLVSDFSSLRASGTTVDLGSAPVAFYGDDRDAMFGLSVDAVADVDGDGRAEVLIAAPSATFRSKTGAGAAYFFHGL